MTEVHLVGVDLAKRVFQLHAIDISGETVYRKKLSRAQFAKFIEASPKVILAMEACATAHYWGRTALAVGHDVRLIPAQYVKPFVKRHKNDAVDAEAITVAATRPSMQTVAVKTEEQQTMAAQFRTRDLFVRQRTQLINALRGHLLEFGSALSQGQYNHPRLIRDTEEVLKQDVPKAMRAVAKTYLRQIKTLTKEIEALEKILKSDAKANSQTRRLQTMPGVGPLTAFAIGAFCPSAHDFKTGRDFSSWLGLVPRQHSTGGKQRLGRITKMGQADVRRLLIIGAMSVIAAAGKAPDKADPWLLRMLEKRPRMVVGIALANRMARRLWAMLKTERDYEIQGVAA